MEHFGLFNPFHNGGRNGIHGKNHGCELLVKSKGELVNKGNVIGNSCFRSEVLKVSDIFLESVVHNSIWAFE